MNAIKKNILILSFVFFGLSAIQKAYAFPYNSQEINVAGAGNGMDQGDVAWADYNGDGLLDVLVSGRIMGSNNGRLRVYRNLGGGLFAANEVDASPTGGLRNSAVDWGDFDGDGDLDILINGRGPGTTNGRQLRIYRNDGAFPFTMIEVPGAANLGMRNGDVAWGDADNDGDLDILTSGNSPGGNLELRVYLNNGDGATFDTTPIEVTGAANGGYQNGGVAWGDYDNDGDLDIAASGADAGGTRRLRVYRNNSDNTFTQAHNFAGHDLSKVAWADFNNDGHIDLLVCGRAPNGGNQNSRLRIFLNNGNGTMNTAINNVNGGTGGLRRGGMAVGDADNDGDIDIVLTGQRNGSNQRQLWFYRNDGGMAFTQLEIDAPGTNHGFNNGDVALGDFDNDNDLDILANGRRQGGGNNRELRVYISSASITTQANTAPTAPAVLVSTFVFSETSVSTATFKWNPGTDAGVGASAANQLTYDIQISTIPGMGTPYIVPGLTEVTPRRGNYLRPPQIYDGNTNHGIILTSTNPWQTQTGAAYGLRTDTSYYYVLRTVDLSLEFSAPNATPGILWTGVRPAAFTDLTAVTGTNPGDIDLTVTTVGDDGMQANVTGFIRLQYSTNPATAWSATATPPSAYTLMFPMNDVAPNTPLGPYTLGNLTDGATYYFRAWTQDDVGLWSLISNSTFAMAQTGGAVPPGAVTDLTGVTGALPGEIDLSWNAPGDDNYDPGTWAEAYDIRYSTIAAESPAISDALFNAASSVDPAFCTIPTPSVQGTTETLTLSGLLEGVTYYFAMKSRDEIPNWSALSNEATAQAQITIRSITVDPVLFDLGSVSMGASTYTVTAATVSYSGNVTSTFTLMASTSTAGTPWSIGTALPTSQNMVVIFGAFDDLSTPPVPADYGIEDIITGTPQAGTAVKYSIDGSETGLNVPFFTADRHIWFYLEMPTTTTTTNQQDITVTIEAGP